MGYGEAFPGPVPVNHEPIGTLDSVTGGVNSVTVRGWAFDPDTPAQSIGVHVYVDGPAGTGRGIGATTANASRPDVDNVYHTGSNHGFEVTVPCDPGTHEIYVHAIDTSGNGPNIVFGHKPATVTTEKEKPVISNVEVVAITPDGYRVGCTVTDNVGVTAVKFPTWVESQGQNGGNALWKDYTYRHDNYYAFDVKVSDHNGWHGVYDTHIYAYDEAGNVSSSGIPMHVPVPVKMTNSGDSTYYLFDDTLSWADAEKRCENAFGGGHLVSIESADEQNVVASLASSGGKTSYWIGASDGSTEGSWSWVTGKSLDGYSNWNSGEPGGGTSENVAAIRKADGTWHDYGGALTDSIGYIMEVDGGAFKRQGDVVEIEEGTYTLNMFADNKYAVDIAGGATESGANAQLYAANGSDAQRFKFTRNDDGTYTVINVRSGMALDVVGAAQGSNANVQQYTPNGSAAQRWYVERDAAGAYYLRAKCSNCYLNAAGYSFANGANMITWYANGNNQQKYTLKRAEHAKAASKQICDVTTDGYTYRIELDAQKSEVKAVQFATWTAQGGQEDDLLWATGTLDGGTVTYEVKVSDHGDQRGCAYITHVYVDDIYGNRYFLCGDNCYVPAMNAMISYGSSTYYLVETGKSWEEAKAKCEEYTYGRDGGHLATIESAGEQEAVAQIVASGSKSAYYLGASSATGADGWSWVDGTDLGGYSSWAAGEPSGAAGAGYLAIRKDGSWAATDGVASDDLGFVVEVEGDDRVGPEFSEVRVTDLDQTGYTVIATLDDPSGVEKVSFATWVPEKGQTGNDALWADGELYEDAETGATTVMYRVSTTDHGGSTGSYATTVWGYDKLGNLTKHKLYQMCEIVVPDAVYASENAVYYRFDKAGTWTDAQKTVAAMPLEGIEMAVVANEADDDALASLLAGADKSAYWLGLADSEGTGAFNWANGDGIDYSHWASGQPGTYSGARYGAVLTSNGKWYGYTDSGVNGTPANMGYIAMVGISEGQSDVPACEGEHAWTDWETVAEATCEAPGQRERHCEACDAYEAEEIPALEHEPLEAIRENETAATCDKAGSYEAVVYCGRCGEEISRETVEVEALGHAAAEPVEEDRNEPTCSAKGSFDEVVYCTRCGEEISRTHKELAKAEHAPADPVEENRVEPTCSREGSYESVVYCKVCGEEVSRETVAIARLEHSWDEGTITTAPTCTEKGERTFTCTVCGEKKTEEVAATGHVADDPVTENMSVSDTCTEGGTYDEVTYCEVCHEELSRVQRTQPAGEHVPVADPAVEPTCTEDGLTEGSHCQVCGTVLVAQERVAATGHIEEEVAAVAPTCTEAGATAGVRCKVCDKVISGCEPIAARGHDYQETVVEPTCAEAGYTEHRCSRCDDVYVTDRVPATAHTAGEPEVESEVPATCEAQGTRTLVTRCADCGKELYRTTETTPSTGHAEGEHEVEFETPATCEGKGMRVLITRCKDCEAVMSRTIEVTPATGHKAGEPTVESENAATCEAPGARVLVTRCEACDKELSRTTEALPATGHSWSEGTVTKEPTCTEYGTKAVTCEVCGKTQTERLPMSDHAPGEETRESEVASTCTVAGHYESVIHCTECGVELSRQTVPLALAPHAWGEWEVAREATTTREGLEIRTCANCRVYETRDIPKLAPGDGIDIAGATIAEIADQDYTGRAVCPEVVVTYEGKTLAEGTDYHVSYKNNKDMGTATVTVTGDGAYAGTLTGEFRIVCPVSKLDVTTPKAQTYTGKALKPAVSVSLDSEKLEEGVDYDVTYASNVNAGKGQVIIDGCGDYVGTRKVTFTIAKAANKLAAKAKAKSVRVNLAKVKKAKVVLASNVKLTNKGTGKVTYKNVSTQAAAKKLKVAAATGKVTVPKGTKKGTYTLKIKVAATGNANYKAGTKTITYKVVVK